MEQEKGAEATSQPAKRHQKLTPKLRERLTEVEAKYMEARLNGATMKDATEAAGLAPFAQSGFRIEKRIAEKCPAVFERVGVTVERIAKKISDKLEAMTDKHFHNKGIVMETRTVEDHATQLHAAELGLKALGALKADDDGVQDQWATQINTVQVVVGDPATAKALAELLSPRGAAGIVIGLDAPLDANAG